jgi:predicted metal-dependent phosphoesterase TrpH
MRAGVTLPLNPRSMVSFGVEGAVGKLLVDLHAHTYPKSDDSFVSADELVDAARQSGLDGICLTEHDDFWPPKSAQELTRRHGILVLPGAEVNTDAGHVLVFGLDTYKFGMHKPTFLREEADRHGAVLVAAHPYRRRFLADPGEDPAARSEMLKRALDDEMLRLFDAVESRNGRGKESENLFADDLRVELGLPGTGGSDTHYLRQMGTAATLFERRVASLDELVVELKAGRMRAVDLTTAAQKPTGRAG